MQTIGDLELDQDLDVQRWSWRVERAGWVIIALVLILAMLGVFSTGPLSSATAGSVEGVEIDYQRFLRNNGEASLDILIAPEQIVDGEIRLWVSGDYLEKTSQLVIEPQPKETVIDGDRQVFTFPAEASSEPVRIAMSYEPETIGRLPVRIGIVDGPSVDFTQFCYP
ncbi:MAG TPA: hypothetical protein VNZ58_08070 [Thermomicrobiales bacterium]|nr:hypothetical protein [Thermomicrobiales bacterium]